MATEMSPAAEKRPRRVSEHSCALPFLVTGGEADDVSAISGKFCNSEQMEGECIDLHALLLMECCQF